MAIQLQKYNIHMTIQHQKIQHQKVQYTYDNTIAKSTIPG